MPRHRGTYARRYIALAEANRKNRRNKARRDALLAELAFNDELWKTYTAGDNFTCPAENPVQRYLLRHHVAAYFKLARVWDHGEV